MQAILVRFLGATNHRPDRYVATIEGARCVVSSSEVPCGICGYRFAAEKLVRDNYPSWTSNWLGGTLPNGDKVFVMDHPFSLY